MADEAESAPDKTLNGVELKYSEVNPYIDRVLKPEFVSSVAELLWPIITISVALLYKKQITLLSTKLGDFLSRIIKARIFGNEFELKGAVENLQTSIESAISVKPKIRDISNSKLSRILAVGLPRESGQELDSRQSFPTSRIPDHERSGLFDRPIEGAILEELRRKVNADPLPALVLVSAELERSIRKLLFSAGELSKNHRSLGLMPMVRILADKFELSGEFKKAVTQLDKIRNVVVHGHIRDEITDNIIVDAAMAGIELAEFVQRIYRTPIIVGSSNIKAYFDAGLINEHTSIEVVELLFAAVPGQTGARAFYPTARINYYQTTDEVSPEWSGKLDVAVYFQHPEDEIIEHFEVATELFSGLRYSDIFRNNSKFN